MARILLVLGACFVFLEGTALAQCGSGGSGGQMSAGGSGSLAMSSGLRSAGSGATLLTGPGSLAYDMMMSQMMAQRLMQQRQMLAMQQAQARQEKLERTRYRAEKARAEKVASRERTRAALAAENGLVPAKTGGLALQTARR
jgi:hypothetical protein